MIIHGFCLRLVKHNDKTSIATVWTLEKGRMALSVPASAGKQAQRLRALLMPMSLFEGVTDDRHDREIHPVRDVKPWGTSASAASDPLKSVISIFLADFLNTVLRENPQDELLTRFIADSIRLMHNLSGTALANFHIVFLMRLGQLLGISPDAATYTTGSSFDMRDGIFRLSPPQHRDVLVGSEATMVATLYRLNYSNMHVLRLNREQRNRILDCILAYYSLHLAPVTNLSSLAIVRQVLS